MRRLDIDFAPKRPLPAWAWYGTSALLLALAIQQSWSACNLQEQVRAWEGQLAAVAAKHDAIARQQREAEAKASRATPYAKGAADFGHIASYPMDDVLTTLESTQIAGIKLIQLDVSPKDRTARADVEFSRQAALEHYLKALNDDKRVGEWSLSEAHTEKGGTSNGIARIETHSLQAASTAQSHSGQPPPP